MVQSFSEFCGGTPFFDENLLLNNTYPEFTECFQNTVLIWVPCGFLWLTLPIYLRYLLHQTNPPLQMTPLNISKTFVSLLLFFVMLVDILYTASNEKEDGTSYPTAVFTAGSIKAASFLLASLLIQVERRRGIITSGILFIFWFLLFITGVVPVYTQIMQKEYDKSVFRFALMLFYYIMVMLSLILASFAETVHRHGYMPVGKAQCPEIYASFPSKLSFWWITSLVVQVYRRGLAEDEVWELNPRDQSKKIVPELQNAWQAEVAKAKNRQKLPIDSPSQETSFMNPRAQSERSLLLNSGNRRSYNTQSSTSREATSKEKKTKGPSLFKVIVKVFGKEVFLGWFCKMIYDFLQYVNPMVLSLLIGFVQAKSLQTSEENDRLAWKGYVYAASLFVVAMLQSVFFHQNFHFGMTAGMRIKSALIAAIYGKSMTMNSEARTKSTVGEIVNLMSVDAQRISDITGYLWVVWSAPLQIILAMILLWNQLGPSVLAGVGVMVLLVPFNACIAVRQRRLQIQQMRLKDSRIKAMNEILNGIKVLKLYAWEPSFEKKVQDVRDQELKVLRNIAFLNAVSTFFWTSAPFLVCLATFMAYILSDNTNYLDAQKAFVSLSLFKLLSFPINLLPMMVSYIIQGNVSIGRIGKFLQGEDLDPDNVQHSQLSDSAISIDKGTFSWGKTIDPALKDITFQIPEGKLVAVVGQVGAGKSSLISAVLGEMEKISGKVTVKGSIAYVAQQAWIQNATVRDNILFGLDMDQGKYHRVIESCALNPDLEILQGGDLTEIGEKGINLSGGQKQRVSLARAVYNNADLYLLDDPLSAVDSHVGKHIFDNVIGSKGLLKNKTRVLVTHGVQWLPLVDSIVVMVDGRITEMGSYDELLSHDGPFAQFLKTYLTQNKDEEEEEDEDPEVQRLKSQILERVDSVTSGTDGTGVSGDDEASRLRKRTKGKKEKPPLDRTISTIDGAAMKDEKVKELNTKSSDKLIEAEKSEKGDVSWRVYLRYLEAIGYVASIFLLLFFLAYQAVGVLANIWLASWTDDPYLMNATNVNTTKYKDLNYMYLGVYGAFGVGQAVLILFYAILAALRMVRAAGLLHNGMLSNILKLPMAFFDTTPLGRIVNRFSRDVETIDNSLPLNVRTFMITFFGALSVLVVIGYSTPLFTIVLIPMAFLYYLVQRFYIPTSRQLKRIESTTRSPIYSHFGESIQGVSTIRGYNLQQRFVEDSKNKVDTNLVYYFAGIASNRWLGFRLEFLGNFIVFAAAMFAVTSKDISGGLVGLSISYALQVTSALNFLVRNTSDVETNIVSVERVKEYTEEPTEAAWFKPMKQPHHDWPDRGNVRFNNYSTRYREGLDLVLKGISCDIQGGERVGIVGRTGAGKSSLTVALFRIIEAAGGSIVIDGERISDMGLHDLRGRITILPQEPILFSGTLRMNLDPFDKVSDAQIWQALEHAHLKTFVAGLPDQLQHECGEGGQNLSVGQRQLVCLARTLLRKTKILVLDEATAAVDMETDDLIQKTIREEFKDCTIITIAHRLNTIMDYDKIMVLDQGLIKEFDTPQSLLSDSSTIFHGMAKNAGLV